MPELAAHLERVAKRERLARQWAQSWLDTQSKTPGINLGEMEQSLAGMLLRWGAQYAKDESAAALAACAREARNEALWDAAEAARRTPFRCHAKDDVDFHSGCVQTQERIVDAIRKLRAERAVGEKAPLDPQGKEGG